MASAVVTAIPIERWGRDHWSTYAYIANRILNNSGEPNLDHMRTDADLHPGLVGPRVAMSTVPRTKYPTRLKDGEVQDHDDWSCVEDFIAAGLVTWEGTGMHPVFRFTEAGWQLWHRFNRHIAANPRKWSTTFDSEARS